MIDSQERAFSELYRRFYPENVLWVRNVNKSRGKLIKTTNTKLYAVYKRERFMTFGKQFEAQGMTGLGESINREVLNILIAENVDRLIVIYPDDMYWIYPKLFKRFAVANNLIRTQKIDNYYKSTTGYDKLNEVTYSVPISLFEKYTGQDYDH